MALSERPDDDRIDHALDAAVAGGLPPQSLALYARWWQLETWLRELAYVELRALRGVAWRDAVKAAAGQQGQDAAFTHMISADAENPLAYLDFSQLIVLVDNHWDQMSYALPEKRAWEGRLTELTHIRHRIGHVRAPHEDDLGRLEQALRDLERGAFIAFASYNDCSVPDESHAPNAVLQGWFGMQHPTAQRLIEHAKRQYDTRLRLRISRRPWAGREQPSMAEGYLWHADFLMQERTVDVRKLWHDDQLDPVRALVVHVRADNPWHVGFTFSAADEPGAVSDAVGIAFDTILENSRVGLIDDAAERRWRKRAALLDYRVHTQSGWNIVDVGTLPVNMFGAGGGVESAPHW